MRRHIFDDFISHRPIHSSLFCDASPATLISISKTCRLAQELVSAWLKLAYNVKNHLAPYFDKNEVLQLRSIQAETGALISGSNALQFLDRATYPGSDLDVYVEADYIEVVGRWLLGIGYTYTPMHSKHKPTFRQQLAYVLSTRNRWEYMHHGGYSGTNIVGVFNMVRGESTIQLIAARITPMETVLNFHSTCVMNFIAYDAVYSLYPRSTFEDRTSLVIRSARHHRLKSRALLKYVERGWKMTQGSAVYLLSPRHRTSAFGGMDRYIGDRYTWTIPLDTTGVTVPHFMTTGSGAGRGLSGSSVTAYSWRLTFHTHLPSYPYESADSLPPAIASSETKVHSSENLKFCYLISDPECLSFFNASYRPKEFTDYVDAEFNKAMKELYDLRARLSGLCTG